jgi:hypothetical protein
MRHDNKKVEAFVYVCPLPKVSTLGGFCEGTRDLTGCSTGEGREKEH